MSVRFMKPCSACIGEGALADMLELPRGGHPNGVGSDHRLSTIAAYVRDGARFSEPYPCPDCLGTGGYGYDEHGDPFAANGERIDRSMAGLHRDEIRRRIWGQP